MLETKLIAKVTTDCLCENEDGTPLEGSCDGYCYEWQKEDVFELLGLWYVGNGIEEDDPILINAESIGWQNRSGFKWTTPMELDGALSLNGDFRIEWYLEDN